MDLLKTPYSIVEDATVLKNVKFLSAFEEKDHPIAQANALSTKIKDLSSPW